MIKILLVGAGGFCGSILRYLLGGAVHRFFSEPTLPYGTLFVNVLGCLLIGLLGGLSESRQVLTAESRLFIFIGLLGGFTTFSTFGYETFQVAKDGEFITMLINIGLHLFLGFGAVWLGNSLSKAM